MKRLLGIALVALTLTACGGETNQWIDAGIVCEQFVTRSLRSPSTAQFPHVRQSDVADLGNGKYTVNSYVDAQNGFGATVRTAYTCTVQHVSGKQFRLIDLQERPR